MSDLPPHAGSDEDDGIPRWVYMFGIVAIILVVIFLIVHLAGFAPMNH